MTELEIQLNQLTQMLNGMKSIVKVGTTFHSQMKQVDALLKNDTTALVSPILNFQIKSANVPIKFDANKTGLSNLINDWAENVNKGLNIDIQKGLNFVGEQYFRERFKSSLIAIRLKWIKVNGYFLPTRIWIMDGGSIYVKNDSGSLNANEYYLGKPANNKKLENSDIETIFIRRPYTQAYDQYPSPYLIQRGAMEFALLKTLVVEKQKEMVNSVFPYYLQLKLGSADAMKLKQMPSPNDLANIADQFKELKSGYDLHQWAKGLIGAHPYDFNMEEFIPDFGKILDEKILKGTDRNLLNSLGMIELKEFSSTRQEAILNPAVLVQETKNAVSEYVDVLKEIVELIKEKNSEKYTVNDVISVQPGIIKGFLTDDMKTLIRGWYDRGLVGDKSALENTTDLLFETQVKEREQERKLGLDLKMFPRVIQNQDNGLNDVPKEDLPDDKKKGTPEVTQYKNANQIKEDLNKIDQFEEELGEYLEAPYTKENYPKQLDKLPIGARNLWIRVFNTVYDETKDENQARQAAWHQVKNKYYKDTDGNWKKK